MLSLLVLLAGAPVLSEQRHHSHDFDPVAERQIERRWERLQDLEKRRDRPPTHKGAFNDDGSRRRFYDFNHDDDGDDE